MDSTTGQPTQKAREVKLRRRADRHGLVLTRNRARAIDAPNYGRYMLMRVTERTGISRPVSGWLDLDGIVAHLDDLAGQR